VGKLILTPISTVKIIHINCTFKYCTKLFLQLFTIRGLSDGHYIPLVYFLLNNKECGSYAKCFNMLKIECFKLNICKKITCIENN